MAMFLCVRLKPPSLVAAAVDLVFVVLLFSLSGCGTRAPATTLSYTMSKNDGGDPTLRIDDLTTIVFVGMDCEAGTAGQIRISHADSIRSGKSSRSGGVEIQSAHGVATLIVQNGEGDSATYLTFKVEAAGKRLVYKETSYSIGDAPKTIVIAEDGSATISEGEVADE